MPNADGGGARGGGGNGTPGSAGQYPVYLPTLSPLPNTIAAQARLLPILYGTAKVNAFLIEMSPPSLRQPQQWAGPQTYPYGSVVASDGGAWKALKSGGSTNQPTGQGAAPTAWAGSTAYALNNVRQNGGNAYQCTKAGTSAGSGGPTGTGHNIVDNGAMWMYLGPLPFPIVQGADSFPWRYIQQLPFPMYRQFFLAALCEGEVQGALSWFFDKERYATFAGTDLGTIALLKGVDAVNQVPTMGDSAGYQHTALLEPADATPGGGIVTGTQKEVPALAVELQGVMFGAATNDVNPADIVNDLLTHSRRGCGWPSARVDATTVTGAGAASYRTYCDAAGLRFSMYIDTQRTALSLLADILNATNSDAIWSQGALKIVPLGDQSITAPVYGAVNYVPANTAQYNLSETDFLDPIQIQRGADADCFNDFPIEFIDRSLIYQRNSVEDPDNTDVEVRGGLVRGSTVSLPMVFPDGSAPIMLSRIYAQRSLNIRNTYTFRLPYRYLLLEPTDVVTLSDATMGLSLLPVRIVSMREESDFTWTVTAEDYPAGVAASGQYTPQAGDGYKPNAVGTTAAGIPTAFGAGAITSPGLANIWPNPTSEVSPPQGVPVGDDGTNPEFDYRTNVGAGARDGNWVRSLPAGKTLEVAFWTTRDEIIRFKLWFNLQSGSTSDYFWGLFWYDASGSLLQSVTAPTGAFAWTLGLLSGRTPAGAVKVVARLGSPNTTGTMWFDSIQLHRLPPAAQPDELASFAVSSGITVTGIDLTTYDQCEFVVSTGAGWGIGAPINAYVGQRFKVKIKNTSGGAIASNFNIIFKMAAWTDPANGKSRAIEFVFDGTSFVQATPETPDIPN